jgi:hypothetical protein
MSAGLGLALRLWAPDIHRVTGLDWVGWATELWEARGNSPFRRKRNHFIGDMNCIAQRVFLPVILPYKSAFRVSVRECMIERRWPHKTK